MPRLGTLLQARRAARGLLADRSSHWRPQWLGGALRCDGGRSSLGVGAPPRFDQVRRSVLGKLLFRCQQKNNYLDLNCEACLRVVGFVATCRHSGSNSRMTYSETILLSHNAFR